MKQIIKNIDFQNKRVFLRVDFNVPLDSNQNIISNARIKAALPTINYLIENGASIILCSHLGRPKGVVVDNLSIEPVANVLATMLKKEILIIEDPTSDNAVKLSNSLQAGDIAILENIRFFEQEEKCDADFGKKLSKLADIFVNEAFGTMHRKHASTYEIAKYIPSAIGFLVEKELKAFDKLLTSKESPKVAILGGAKVSDKLPILEYLIDKVDHILIGGAMAYTFIKAIGGEVGDSIVDDSMIELSKNILDKAKDNNINIMLPIDNYAGNKFSNDARQVLFNGALIYDGFIGMDIGPQTIKAYKKIIKQSKIIIWNGPMGVYEFKKYQHGTLKIAKAVAKSKAYAIIGGGDSIASIQKLKLDKKISHISTGGGVSLKLLEGKKLDCLEIIQDC